MFLSPPTPPSSTSSSADMAGGSDYISTRYLGRRRQHSAFRVRICRARNNVLVTVTHSAAAVNRWLYINLLQQRLRHRSLIVGLGVQYNYNKPRVATIQICVGHRCLVFQACHCMCVPSKLKRFFEDRRITFVGISNSYDFTLLKRYLDLRAAKKLVEVRDLAQERRPRGAWNKSMGTLADEFLGYEGVEKPREIALSNWEAYNLSKDQVEYATVDAFIAFKLGLLLLP